MSVDGVWTTQYLGQTGWENIGVVVIDGGRVLGGGRHHYVIGGCTVSGNSLTIELHTEVHGATQTFFGMNDKSFDLIAEVELDGDSFYGTMRRTGVDQYSMEFRANRRTGLSDSTA